MRALRNPTADTVMEMEARGTDEDELYPFLRGDLGRKAYLEGELDKGIISVGEVVGLMRDVPTVKQVIDGIVEGAQGIVERLHTLGAPAARGNAS